MPSFSPCYSVVSLVFVATGAETPPALIGHHEGDQFMHTHEGFRLSPFTVFTNNLLMALILITKRNS